MENKEELYNFYAMLDRMQYIQRWGLMRKTRQENLRAQFRCSGHRTFAGAYSQ